MSVVAEAAVGLEWPLAVTSDPVPLVVVVHAPTNNSATHAISATDVRFPDQQLSAVIDSTPRPVGASVYPAGGSRPVSDC